MAVMEEATPWPFAPAGGVCAFLSCSNIPAGGIPCHPPAFTVQFAAETCNNIFPI